MGTLLTAAVFILATALLIARHVHRSRTAGPAPAAPVRLCPRCGASAPTTAAFQSAHCRSCGVPFQAFELVEAGESVPMEGGGCADPVEMPATARVHATVRADLCVGCGLCVGICPEPGAIRVDGKVAVVDTQLCVAHGFCAEVCPVSAIVLTSGEAVHKVEVPKLDANFQTNVPGVYIVGELGGRGLLKNAVNEGRIAVEHVARELPPGALRADRDARALDVVIVGGGPAGLSAGLEAARLGLSYAILERGDIADTIRKYPRHKILLAEPVDIPLYGRLWIADGSKESLLQVWETILANTGVDVRTHRQVRDVTRSGDLFLVATAGETLRARRVILAMGRRGTPRRLEVPGEERSNVFYDIVEMEAFAGRRVLVVGGGDSAVESAVGLSNQPGTTVTLSYRGGSFHRVKDRNRARLEKAVAGGSPRLLLNSRVIRIDEGRALLEAGGLEIDLPLDDVIVRVGGEPPAQFLDRIGIRRIRKDIPIVRSQAAAQA